VKTVKTKPRSMTNRLSHAQALAFATTLALTLLMHATARTAFAQSAQTPAPVQLPAQSPAQTQPAGTSGGSVSGGRTVEVRERGVGFIHGRITGEAGEPLAGVMVYVSQRGINQGFFRPQRVATDEEGNFTITGLDPGLYNINASVPGFIVDNDPMTSRPIAYRPGDTASVRLVKGGVITGTVTDPQGEPVVGIAVRAFRVRDAEGRPVSIFGSNYGTEDSTDDRGVYRIYGIIPGVYVVSAGSSNINFFGFASAYAGNVSTFYPSATRDTAQTITVRAGEEVGGIDIRYRGERGHAISGVVSGAAFDHNVTGLDLMQRGLIAEALEEFRKGLRHSPDSAELCYNMGVAHDYLAETRKAAEFYERATKLDPEFVEAFCGLGTAYSKLGKGLEAIRACIQAIRLQPSHLDAHNALALAYFHWGSYPEAAKACNKALAIDPGYTQARYTLGLIHLDLGEKESALAQYNILKDSDPSLAEYLFQQIPR